MRVINLKSHKKLKIVALAVLVAVLGVGAAAYHKMNPLLSYNPADVPPITASPIDVSRVFSISYFRSDAGHDYSQSAWDGETCRSMKNYFNWSQYQPNGLPVRSMPTADHPDINIYAPLDGKIIANVKEQVPIGTQIHIASSQNSHFVVIIFHVDLLPSLHVGSMVKSGQQIGTIGPMDGIDAAYEAYTITGKVVYMSIFDHMTTRAFAPYAAMGYKPSDFVLTRAQADAKHYQCSGGQFVRPANFYSSGNAQTEGAVLLRPNPYQYIYNQQGPQNQQTRGNVH